MELVAEKCHRYWQGEGAETKRKWGEPEDLIDLILGTPGWAFLIPSHFPFHYYMGTFPFGKIFLPHATICSPWASWVLIILDLSPQKPLLHANDALPSE